MAYWLEYDEVAVAPYLLGLDLSVIGRDRLQAALQREIAECADIYIGSPERRLAPDSEYFRVDLVFRDPESRHFHSLHFVISDAAAAFGILRVVYVENKVVRSPFSST